MSLDYELILKRLKRGRPLTDLGLPVEGGRILLAEFSFPLWLQSQSNVPWGTVNVPVEGFVRIYGATWRDTHFRKCDFTNTMFWGGNRFVNCVFERCNFYGAGMWGGEVKDCRFVSCDLRKYVFGGDTQVFFFSRRKPTKYNNVEFYRCNIAYTSFVHNRFKFCRFYKGRLHSIDVRGATLEDCTFEGRLTLVRFFHDNPLYPRGPKNNLLRCDFRKAVLKQCEFINIDLDLDMLPEDEDLILLPRGPKDLTEWKFATGLSDRFIEFLIRHSGAPGVVNRSLLQKSYSEDQVQLLVDIASR